MTAISDDGADPQESTMIFVNTAGVAQELGNLLCDRGYSCAQFHKLAGTSKSKSKSKV